MKKFKVTELTPAGSHKSFYGKAIVIHTDNISRLKSHNTIVAEYNHKTKKMTVNGWYSATTARHINSFLNLFGYDSMTKAEMEDINYKFRKVNNPV